MKNIMTLGRISAKNQKARLRLSAEDPVRRTPKGAMGLHRVDHTKTKNASERNCRDVKMQCVRVV